MTPHARHLTEMRDDAPTRATSIAIPHGLAAAVLAVLTTRGGRWVDEDELVDLVRCQYSEALDAFPNEGAHACDVMDAASDLAGKNFLDEDPVYRVSEVDAASGETFYAWRLELRR